MAQYDLGKVSIRPRGAYAANTNYEFLDSVQNLGGSWLALAASKDVQPGVTAGWQNYWMMFTKGLRSVVGTSPADGQSLLTFTFSDGSTATYTYVHDPIADDSVTESKIADNAVITRTIADLVVTRAKLAQDALFSPWIVSGSRDIVASDIGSTLQNNWEESATYTLTQAVSATLPMGAELAVLRGGTYEKTIVSIVGSGIRFGIPDDMPGGPMYPNATLKITSYLGLVAIRKIAADNTNGDLWGVYGNVEVVT